MPWISRYRSADRADDEHSMLGLEPQPTRTELDLLREDFELDADAGRIAWHEIGDRLAAARAAMSASPLARAA